MGTVWKLIQKSKGIGLPFLRLFFSPSSCAGLATI